MADKKISQFTADASPSTSDIFPTVKSPFGATDNRKVTLADLKTLMQAGAVTGSGATNYVTIWSGASTVAHDTNFFWSAGSGGRLGVGTVSPSAHIHASSAANTEAAIMASNSSNGGTAYTTVKVLNDLSKSTQVGIYGSGTSTYGAITANMGWIYNNADNGLVIMSDSASAPIIFASGGNAEDMRLTVDGKLGIGTPSPSTTLHTVGDGRFTTGLSLTSATTVNAKYQQTSADFTNPITDVFGANTYFAVQNAGGTIGGNLAHGGAFFGGVSNGTDQSGITLFGASASTSPTQATISLIGVKSDGATDVQPLSATEVAVNMGTFGSSGLNVLANGDLKFAATSGTSTISTGETPGLLRAVNLNIPIASGGASGAALDMQMQLDGTLEAGLLADTDGAGSYMDAVFKIPHISADFGAAWASVVLPSPTSLSDGCMVILYNSNAAVLGSRTYVRTNGAWKFTALV